MEVSQTELARIFGVTPRTIRDYHGLGLEDHRDGETGSYDLPASVAWRLELEWERALSSTTHGTGDSRQNYEEARARKTAADAQLKEDELAAKRGELIPAERALQKIREPLEAVDAKLRASPRRMGREWSARLGVSRAEAMAMIDDLVEEVRADLLEVFKGDDGDD